MDTLFDLKDNEFIAIGKKQAYSEEDIKTAFMKSLKEIREYANLSLKELSLKTQIPIATLSAYENGTRTPSFIFAIKICAFFGSTLESFILNGLNESTEYGDIFTHYDYSRGK